VRQRYGRELSSLDVSHIIFEAQTMRSTECDKLLLCDEIVGGTIIDLLIDNGQKLKLLYLGGNDFCLLHDSANELKPMDVLKSLSLKIDLIGDAYFRILREDKPFPNDRKLFRCHIEKIEKERGCIRRGSPKIKRHPEKTSEAIVYAWKVTNGLFFSQDDLTENTDALFVIDVKNMLFGVNSQYNKNLSLYKDMGNIMHEACNVVRLGQGLQTIVKGCINLYENDLYITEKARVAI